MTEWHEDGTVILACNYELGYLDGPWHERWPDGQDRCRASYRMGLLEGLFTEWSRAGTKIFEGPYQDGARHGEWTSWYPDGKLRGKFEYVEGVLKNDLERQKREEAAAQEPPK